MTAHTFVDRHNGPRSSDLAAMLAALGYASLDDLIDVVVPTDIRLRKPLALPAARSEADALADIKAIAAENKPLRSRIGMGYADCRVPAVIQRNVLENPGWYTAYTPYQPEIAQGRLEALLNFQTMVSDLTGLPIANASLLDEGTAAAEGMALTLAVAPSTDAPVFLIDAGCHPQTIAVVVTRAEARGVATKVQPPARMKFKKGVIGALLQYPATDGGVHDFRPLAENAHKVGALVTVAADLMSLALLVPPGEWGADICVGNSQRFGVPLGYGGPHAAFFSTRDEHKRHIPGRLIGVSKDREGQPALRMALQTREQHIRREKATSNVCTAQVLLAVMASMYSVYHGPEGIRAIATAIHRRTAALAAALKALGYTLSHDSFFDTLAVETGGVLGRKLVKAALKRGINLRTIDKKRIGIALDETTTDAEVQELAEVFKYGATTPGEVVPDFGAVALPTGLVRTTPYLTHPVFSEHHSETEMLRYIRRLEAKDLSLTAAMIPLGSCTMKLNATTEMIPVSWPEFGGLHPFAPAAQAKGYARLFADLEEWLAEITGFHAISLQPNAGSQGEYAGLLVIRAWHRSREEAHRNVCLIPQSAHGTNPASAVMAGMRVVVVKTDAEGNIDITDLRARAEEHAANLSALMVTYPSTHGVFEGGIAEICRIVHHHGGQVYMDGANMNAQVGLCRPGDIGADVCHLNLHKTFCIPHGGGGPGMGPIGVAEHLTPFLPSSPIVDLGHPQSCGAISAAPWGSASILPISWAYIAMMGPDGLTEATRIAILNANYIAHRLKGQYTTLYTGNRGLIAHECIIDFRMFKQSAGIEVEDVAKRLIDFSFHPPTVSFPVAGTLMIEPTESESKMEIDRFCDALLAIREEIREVESGAAERGNNILHHAPHTLRLVAADEWTRPYPREKAAFPSAATRQHKVWPTVSRIDGAYGDRNLVCTCPPVDDYTE
ncbi:MAG: aminomethyl-transferring glycine dehydrogenase [Gemmatimonadota bacterium]|nr:aminomethyl-transferring glycine dehydrogenase [Gemmatimonadota bacterium]